MYTRRNAIRLVSMGVGAGLAGLGGLPMLSRSALAAERSLELNLLGYALAIHVPTTAALYEVLPSMAGYTEPTINRMEHIRLLTQSLIAGDALFGESDFLSAMRAIEAGAELRVIGNYYANTSLVLTVNADKIKSIEDLLKPGIRIGINGKGDGTHVPWAGALVAKGLDPDKVEVIEIGGSGSRMRALLAGRIDGCPIHIDQAARIKQEGNYVILVEPWKIYHPWLNEVWVTSADTLKKPDNERAAVDLLKACVTAFRRANNDFEWYAASYRKYATIKKAKDAPDEQIRAVWEVLRGPAEAWPADMNFSPANAERLRSVYLKTGALKGTVDFQEVMTTKYLDQALAELG